MNPTATADHNSVRAAPAAAPSLNDAVRAVTEHRRAVEMRRMAHAAQQRQPADWMVPVPRARLEALERQAREALLLRRLLENEPLSDMPAGTQPLLAERHLPSKPNQRRRLDARPAPSA